MRTRFFALAAAIIFALAQVPAAYARGVVVAAADWSSVQALAPGEKIAVRTKDGDRLKGRFESATETDINFDEGGRKVTLRRDTVGRVEVARGKKRWQGALVGAGVGVGTGAAAGGYVVARTDHFGGDPLPAGIAVGAGVGAALGAALGLGTNYETVYEAP
jgi:hypothetical protein